MALTSKAKSSEVAATGVLEAVEYSPVGYVAGVVSCDASVEPHPDSIAAANKRQKPENVLFVIFMPKVRLSVTGLSSL